MTAAARQNEMNVSMTDVATTMRTRWFGALGTFGDGGEEDMKNSCQLPLNFPPDWRSASPRLTIGKSGLKWITGMARNLSIGWPVVASFTVPEISSKRWRV